MGKTLTKAKIVDAMYAEIDRNRSELKKIVESVLAVMKDAVKRDHALLVSGFGKFMANAKKARKGRNPATSETMILGPRTVVVFRASRKLREALDKTLGQH